MAVTFQSETRDEEAVATDHRALLDDLLEVMNERPANWHSDFIRTVAAWPIENETVYGETFHYFIGSEAFNWKRLAERIATQLADEGCSDERSQMVFDWIGSSGVFGGLGEQKFRRILGVDGWRAHLNHFYGVHIEQCLLAAVQSRIQKRRYSSGKSPSDDASERAFLGLYEETEETLWGKFTDENSERLSKLIAESKDDNRSIALEEEFTYWLFKRRIENTNAPQVAAETQRGLDMMSRMDQADDRRSRLLKDENGGALLEFGLVKRRNGKPILS